MHTISKNVILLFFFSLLISIPSKSQTNFIWGKQFGSMKDEYVLNHLTDKDGNIYVAGKTTGNMDGENKGNNDGFLTKIDSLGNTIWTRQFGTPGDEDIQWSAIDNAGCVYITGTTTGDLGIKNAGLTDIFVVKYNPGGVLEWSKQFGTDSTDIAKCIYVDSKGYIYVSGATNGVLGKASPGKMDCYIMKLDIKGDKIFTSQFGTPKDDFCYSITGNAGSNIFVCGTTWGNISAENKGFIDAFVGEFTNELKQVKLMQFGSEGFDIAMSIEVDKDKSIYVGGTTSGNYGCEQIGEGDCFLTKIDVNGKQLWNKQFGTKNNDGVRSICINNAISDNILVSGIFSLPPGQAFIRMYDKDGGLSWEQKFIAEGNNSGTSGKDVSLDTKGNIYHLGLTGANLFNTLIGEHDAYLVKLRLDKEFSNR
jgi:hypothetical protein